MHQQIQTSELTCSDIARLKLDYANALEFAEDVQKILYAVSSTFIYVYTDAESVARTQVGATIANWAIVGWLCGWISR
jgi:hypothetical protein